MDPIFFVMIYLETTNGIRVTPLVDEDEYVKQFKTEKEARDAMRGHILENGMWEIFQVGHSVSTKKQREK
jgi:hypothetical protein